MAADNIKLALELRLLGLFRCPGFFGWLWEDLKPSGPAANDEGF